MRLSNQTVLVAIMLVGCTPTEPGSSGSADAALGVDATVEGTPDAATGPLAGCEDHIACCTAPGVSGSGVHDDECGSDGFACDNCALRGERCRTRGDGDYFCTPVLGDGQLCTENWQCLGEACSEAGACDTPCVALGLACQPDIGRTTCCDSGAVCTPLERHRANQYCCYPAGTIVGSIDECAGCCNSFACDFVSPGEYQCQADD